MRQGEGTNSSFAMSRLNSLCSADSEVARARLAALVSATDSRPNISLLTVLRRQGSDEEKGRIWTY